MLVKGVQNIPKTIHVLDIVVTATTSGYDSIAEDTTGHEQMFMNRTMKFPPRGIAFIVPGSATQAVGAKVTNSLTVL